MNIECGKCGARFESLEAVRVHWKRVHGNTPKEPATSSANSSKESNRPTVIVRYPPQIPFPAKLKRNKPFMGAYSNKEIVVEANRYCALCGNKGLTGHLVFMVVDCFWCDHCQQALWIDQTFIERD